MQSAASADRVRIEPVEDFVPSNGCCSSHSDSRDAPSNHVVEEVRTGLNRVGRLTFRRIKISQGQGEIVLRGSVRTWFEKQLAQHVTMQVASQSRVINALIVDPNRSRDG